MGWFGRNGSSSDGQLGGVLQELREMRRFLAADAQRRTSRDKPRRAAGAASKRATTALVKEVPTYLLSTFLLRRCRYVLTRTPDEALLILTGVECGNLRVPVAGCRPPYASVSTTGVVAEGHGCMRVLRQLGEHGHRLQVMAHSHPGRGRASVRESSIDIANQGRYERAGYSVISGIFSRDGFIRFFSNGFDFKIQPYGSCVEQVEEHVLRLQ